MVAMQVTEEGRSDKPQITEAQVAAEVQVHGSSGLQLTGDNLK